MRGRSLLCRRATVSVLVCLLIGAGAGTSAGTATSWANGDPASDVLLAQDVFYPYQPRVSAALEGAMERTLRATARGTGLYLKVAIIGAPEELGIVPKFFGHPQAYAHFLNREIVFNQPQPLLVVMPAGFGLAQAGPVSALAGVSVDTRHGADGLTRSAIQAVGALARARNSRIALPAIPASGSAGHGPPVLLVFGLPVLLLALGGLLGARMSRARRTTEPRDPDTK